MITFKRATNKDTPLIEQLYLQKIDELAAKGITQWEKEEVLWTTLSSMYQPEQFYFALVHDEICGAFVIVDEDPTYWLHDQKGSALYIHKVMVLDKVHGKGVSDAILSFFKQLGKTQGYPCVKLDVRAYKDKLIAYYERNGFTLVDTVDLQKGYLTRLYEYRYNNKEETF